MMKRLFIPVAVFLIIFSLYCKFPSNQYTAVDGNLRCLPLMNSDKWSLHGNNHMLYPVNVMVWSRAMRFLFKMRPTNPFDFIRMVELMNSFFAAIGILIFFLILKRITQNLTMSIIGAFLLAFSNAFLINAVNSNEPMVGFTLSLASTAFVYKWLDSKKMILGFIGALSLALSAATYQSMLSFVVPIIVLIVLLSLKKGGRVAISNSIIYLVFVLTNFFIIYFLSHRFIGGERSLDDILKRLFALSDYEVWGRLRPLKFLAIPFGISYGFIYLDNMQDGVRAFFTEQPLNHIVLSGIALYILTTVFLILLICILFKIFKEINADKKIFLIVATTGFISSLFAPIFWSMVYTKFLMQPTAASIAFIALLVSETGRLANRSVSSKFKIFLSVSAGLIMIWNFNAVLLRMHFQPSNINEAKELSESLGEETLIILDWDSDIANLYNEFYKRPSQRVFSISLEMIMLNRDKLKFAQKLKDEIASFKDSGRKVYFLGVLEKTRSKWQYFLTERLNIDYEIFDQYRKMSKFVRRYGKTNLYEY